MEMLTVPSKMIIKICRRWEMERDKEWEHDVQKWCKWVERTMKMNGDELVLHSILSASAQRMRSTLLNNDRDTLWLIIIIGSKNNEKCVRLTSKCEEAHEIVDKVMHFIIEIQNRWFNRPICFQVLAFEFCHFWCPNWSMCDF